MAEETAAVEQPKKKVPGGRSAARDLNDEEKALFEEHRDVIESKLHNELQVEKEFKIVPVNVRRQIVAGKNYFFQVNLPNNESAEVKIFRPLPSHPLDSLPKTERVTVTKK